MGHARACPKERLGLQPAKAQADHDRGLHIGRHFAARGKEGGYVGLLWRVCGHGAACGIYPPQLKGAHRATQRAKGGQHRTVGSMAKQAQGHGCIPERQRGKNHHVFGFASHFPKF